MKLHYYGTVAPPKLHYEKGYNGHGFGSLFARLFSKLALKTAAKTAMRVAKVAGKKVVRIAARKAVPLAKKAVKKAAINAAEAGVNFGVEKAKTLIKEKAPSKFHHSLTDIAERGGEELQKSFKDLTNKSVDNISDHVLKKVNNKRRNRLQEVKHLKKTKKSRNLLNILDDDE